MIVQMKKASMVVQAKDRDGALESLADLGLVHLEAVQCTSPEIEAVTGEQDRAKKAYHFLAEYKTGEERTPPSGDPSEATRVLVKLQEELEDIKDKEVSLKKELAELEPWGDFEPGDFKDLESKGYFVKLYQASPEQLPRVMEMEDAVVLNRDKKGAAFAHIARELVTLEDFSQFQIPSRSPRSLREEEKELLKRRATLEEEARSYYPLKDVLKEYMEDLEGELEYQVARASALEDGSLAALAGYIPVDREEPLREWAEKNAIGIALSDPREDDPIPTLTRNPRWLEVIRPVFDFLGTVPGYRELDISIFFLAFFIIFFAMIINDAAYGAIFFLAGLGAVLYFKKQREKPPLAAWLFTILGTATVLWGTVTGSWFGGSGLIEGTFLEKLIITPLVEGVDVYTPAGQFYKTLTGQDVIKLLCFVIALIHLSIAQVWNVLQELAHRSLKVVAQFAWIGINVGLFYLVLNMVMYFDLDKALGTGDLVQRISLVLILGGLSLVILFGYQEGHFVKGVLAGLAGLLPTALGTVSAFGDIISYIRLFAVGLAGEEIARSFNSMAAGLFEGNAIIVGVFVLVLGHGLNFILCSLGVLVHGIRLNMLEFSGRLGMEWSGHPYRPFGERQREPRAAGMKVGKMAPAAAGDVQISWQQKNHG